MLVAEEVAREDTDIKSGIGRRDTPADLAMLPVKTECVEEEHRIKYLFASSCTPVSSPPDGSLKHCRDVFIPHDIPVRCMSRLHKRTQSSHTLFVPKDTVTDKNG